MEDKSYYINSFYVRVLGVEEGVHKPKLVFLHGLLGGGQNWLSIAKAFQEKFTILLVDQRGHGKSKPVQGGFSPEEFAKDLDGITKELGWEKFSMVGHSLGARVAFCFASAFPEKVEKVIFEDMGPHKTGEASIKTRVMIESVPTPFQNKAEARGYFREVFKLKYGKILADYLYSNLITQDDGESMDWKFSKKGALEILDTGQERDFWKEFEAVSCENLIIRGERSEHLPLTVFNEMLTKNANSVGVEISGAGHWVHFDQTPQFVKEVEAFLGVKNI